MKRREGLFVDVTPPTANRATWTDYREATVPEVVEWLGEQGVGEIAESVGVTFYDMPEGKDGLMLAVDGRGWTLEPGRYLVVRIEGEK